MNNVARFFALDVKPSLGPNLMSFCRCFGKILQSRWIWTVEGHKAISYRICLTKFLVIYKVVKGNLKLETKVFKILTLAGGFRTSLYFAFIFGGLLLLNWDLSKTTNPSAIGFPMPEVLPNLLEEDSDEPEHEGEAFYNDLFHLKLVLVVVSDGPQPEKVAFWKGSVPLGKSDGW